MSELIFYDLTYDGPVVQAILDTAQKLRTDGYIFMGAGTPETVPGTPTERVWYLCGPGTYANFGSSVAVPEGSVMVVSYGGAIWTKTVIAINGGAAVSGWKVVDSAASLPSSPEDPSLGWIVDNIVYLYVGEGGDTLSGKYQSMGDFQGPQGADGAPGAQGPAGLDGISIGDNWAAFSELSQLDGKTYEEKQAMVPDGNAVEEVLDSSKALEGKTEYRITSTVKTTGVGGDTALTPTFSTTTGHTYEIRLKSDALLLEDASGTVYMGIPSIGYRNISATAQQILDGVTLTREWATGDGRYVYIRMSTYLVANIHIEIRDLTQPNTLPQEVVELPFSDSIINDASLVLIDKRQVVKRTLYIGGLLQYGMYNGGEVNRTAINPTRVAMNDWLFFPKRDITLHAKLPRYVKAELSMSSTMKFPASGVFTTLSDGDEIEVTGTSYRLGFNYSGRGITPAMVNAWIANGELSLWYEEEFSSIMDRNNMGEVMAVVGDKDTSIYPKTGVTNTQQPQYTFVHASDFHGDVTRFRNVMDLARQLRADGALLTGDFTSDGLTTTGNEFVHEVLSEYDVPAVVCVGNHDTGVTNMDNQKVFDALISPLVASQGYESASGTPADKTWFFRDFATQKLRVISLNLYETDHTQADRTFISQAQIDWFIATLASVPSGYGVILAYHVSETLPTAIEGHEVWWNSISVPTGHTNAPIVKIIDAFIAKTTLSITFVSHGKSGVGDVTINVSADFTGVASNEFIAHFVGHTHVDCVGLAPDTAHRQIVMCVTCANPYALSAYKYLANGSVIPRGADSMMQDAINVVGIDRTNKRIGIARVGSRYRYATLDEMVGFRTSYM